MKGTLLVADSSTGGKYWCCVWDDFVGDSYHGSIKNAPQHTGFNMKGPTTVTQKIKGKLKKDYMTVATFDFTACDSDAEKKAALDDFMDRAQRSLETVSYAGLFGRLASHGPIGDILKFESGVETARAYPGQVQLDQEQEELLRKEHYKDNYGAW